MNRAKKLTKTDHGPKVVSHLLPVLKDGPEEEIPPRMFTALLQLREVLLAVEQSALRWLLLKRTDSTLDLLNMYRKWGSRKQFMQRSMSTWVIEFMEHVTAKSITPTAKEVVFMFHCLSVIINIMLVQFIKKKVSLYMTVFWKRIINSKNVKEQECEINIKTKHIYTNTFNTYGSFRFGLPWKSIFFFIFQS